MGHHRHQTNPLNDPPLQTLQKGDGSQEPAIAGRVPQPYEVVHRTGKTAPIRPLILKLVREVAHGALQDSELAHDVIDLLNDESRVQLLDGWQPQWMIDAIRMAVFYFTPIRLSAGTRSWQRDDGTTTTPKIVGWGLDA